MKTIYECELCGKQSENQKLIALHEEKGFAPKPFSPGDVIRVKTRYEGLKEATVKNLAILLYPSDSEDDFELNQLNHQWSVKVDNQYQIGKSYYTSYLPYWAILAPEISTEDYLENQRSYSAELNQKINSLQDAWENKFGFNFDETK